MLFIYDAKEKLFTSREETDFKSNEVLERKDIEKWVIEKPELLGEDLLIITTEYDKFDKTKERLDLLAVDKSGKLVVVELKRDDSGRGVELQAIKYAAYCSTLTLKDIVELRRDFVSRRIGAQGEEVVEKEVFGFISNDEFEELDDKPRIMLVAREFRPEVTASVLWLRKFGIDVSCVKLTPYKIDDARLALVSSTIIPLPEADGFTIGKKEISGTSLTRSQEEYIEFFKDVARALGPNIGVSLSEPGGRSYYAIPAVRSGIHFEVAFHGRPRDSIGVELHFETAEKERNLKFLREMERYKDEIERATGEKVVLQEDWGKAWSRLYLQKQGGQLTEELKTWAVEKMTTLYKLLQPKILKLP